MCNLSLSFVVSIQLGFFHFCFLVFVLLCFLILPLLLLAVAIRVSLLVLVYFLSPRIVKQCILQYWCVLLFLLLTNSRLFSLRCKTLCIVVNFLSLIYSFKECFWVSYEELRRCLFLWWDVCSRVWFREVFLSFLRHFFFTFSFSVWLEFTSNIPGCLKFSLSVLMLFWFDSRISFIVSLPLFHVHHIFFDPIYHPYILIVYYSLYKVF